VRLRRHCLRNGFSLRNKESHIARTGCLKGVLPPGQREFSLSIGQILSDFLVFPPVFCRQLCTQCLHNLWSCVVILGKCRTGSGIGLPVCPTACGTIAGVTRDAAQNARIWYRFVCKKPPGPGNSDWKSRAIVSMINAFQLSVSLSGRGAPVRDTVPAYTIFLRIIPEPLLSTRIFARIPYGAAIPVPVQQPASRRLQLKYISRQFL